MDTQFAFDLTARKAEGAWRFLQGPTARTGRCGTHSLW